MGSFRREAGLWLAALLALRVLCWAGLNGGEDCAYIDLAGRLGRDVLSSAQGGRVAWTLWLALCRVVAPVRGLSAGWVSLPPFALLVLLAARWGWELGGKRAARAILLVAAVHPRLSYYATLAYPETCSAALLALSVSLLMLSRRSWSAGILGGLAFLCHEVALAPLLLVPFLIREQRGRIARYAAGFALVWAADAVLKTALTGDPLHHFHQAVDVTSAAHRHWIASPAAVLRRTAVDWWRPMARPLDRLFVFDAGATALALLGWLLALRSRQVLLVRIGAWWLLSLILLDLIPSSLFPYVPALSASNPRHLLPLALPLVLLAGNGLLWLLARGWGRVAAALFLAVSLGASFVLGLDARHRVSVCARACGVLEGLPPEEVWADSYSALMLRALLPEPMVPRIRVIQAGTRAEGLKGFVLWDPVWWERLETRGRGSSILASERGRWPCLATFEQRLRPSQWGRSVPPPAVLYRLGLPEPPVKGPVLDRLGHVGEGDALGAVQVRDRARHLQDAVIGPRREAHLVHGPVQEARLHREGAEGLDLLRAQPGVRFPLPLRLPASRLQHHLPGLGGRKPCLGLLERLARHPPHFQVDVDPVQQRS